MVFHIARAVYVFGFEGPALEFVKDRAVGFFHHVRQNGQAATMWHADDNVLHTQLTTTFDDLFHGRDQCFAAV